MRSKKEAVIETPSIGVTVLHSKEKRHSLSKKIYEKIARIVGKDNFNIQFFHERKKKIFVEGNCCRELLEMGRMGINKHIPKGIRTELHVVVNTAQVGIATKRIKNGAVVLTVRGQNDKEVEEILNEGLIKTNPNLLIVS